jgi:hypothetical protein
VITIQISQEDSYEKDKHKCRFEGKKEKAPSVIIAGMENG